MSWQNPPMFVTIAPDRVPAESPETTVTSILFGSLGVAGVLLLVSVLLGAAFAFLLVRRHRRHPPERDHLPSVSPFASHPDTHHSSQPR